MLGRRAVLGLTLVAVFYMPSFALGGERSDVVQFMKLCGIEKGLRSSVDYYRQELKKKYPELPKSFFTRLDPDLDKYVSDMMKFYTKAYSEAFSPEDMRQILAFYSTPSGQKFSQFNNKSMSSIAQHAANKMQAIDNKVEKELKILKR